MEHITIFTALAIAFVTALYALYARRVGQERNRYRNAARRFTSEAKKNYKLAAHWKKTAESNYDMYVKAVREGAHYKGLLQTAELERDAANSQLDNAEDMISRRGRLIRKLSNNRAYTRTPERHWRRQDKLMELKYRRPDGSYEQF